jgi:hypothetical protein
MQSLVVCLLPTAVGGIRTTTATHHYAQQKKPVSLVNFGGR